MFGPLAQWEVVRSLRRRSFFWLRTAYVGLLALMFLWHATRFAGGGYWQPAALADFADAFVRLFAFAQITGVLILTTAYVAPTIAAERRQRTLEYLIVSLLSDHEIIVGKLVGRALVVLALVLAGLPLLFLAALLGGVGFDVLLALTAVTVAITFSAAGIAIFVSVHSSNERNAILGCSAVLFFWIFGADILEAISQMVRGLFPLSWLLRFARDALRIEPYGRIQRLFEVGGTSWPDFLASVLAHAAIGMCAIAYATARLRPVALAKLSDPFATARRHRARRARSIPEIGDQPVAWKEWHFDSRLGLLPRTLLALFLIAVVLSPFADAITAILVGRSIDPYSINAKMRVIHTVLICIALLQLAVRAATSVGAERDNSSWPVLLSTPLTGREVVLGKLLGSAKPLLYLLVLLTPAWLFAVCLGSLSLLAIPIIILSVCVFGYFACCVGVAKGHLFATTGKAITETVMFLGLASLIGLAAFGMSPLVIVPLAMFSSDELSQLYGSDVWFMAVIPFLGSWSIYSAYGRVEVRYVMNEFDQRRVSYRLIQRSKRMVWQEIGVHEA